MTDLANFGDSVHWGQGHPDSDKFAYAVAEVLGLTLRMVAHSGATIGVDATCSGATDGEVPFACPTIMQQVRAYANPDGADVVLLNGGINDVSVVNIINPIIRPDEVRRRARKHCHVDMSMLLREVLGRFQRSETRVVVTSYFPIFSSQSDLEGIENYLAAHFIFVPQGAEFEAQRRSIFDRVIENAQVFWTESTDALQSAIRDIGSARVQFAFVPFADANAMFAPSSWLWEVHRKGFELVPEDPLAEERRAACDAFHSSPLDRSACYIASAGHPNVPGSRSFTDTILALLQ